MNLRLRLFITYAIVILIFLIVVALGVTLLMRPYVDRQSLSRLDDMTRPIYVQMVALIRGNVTSLELLSHIQEQADKNGAYILLVDEEGNIVRQMVPQQPKTLPPIEVESGVLPQNIASSVTGKFTATNGRTFLYAAYPLARQSGQLSAVDAIVLATPQPGTFAALRYFIWPLFIAVETHWLFHY